MQFSQLYRVSQIWRFQIKLSSKQIVLVTLVKIHYCKQRQINFQAVCHHSVFSKTTQILNHRIVNSIMKFEKRFMKSLSKSLKFFLWEFGSFGIFSKLEFCPFWILSVRDFVCRNFAQDLKLLQLYCCRYCSCFSHLHSYTALQQACY